MNKSLMFKKAHALAKQNHIKGMNYSVTFSISLKIVWEESKMETKAPKIEEVDDCYVMCKVRDQGLTPTLWEKNGHRRIYVKHVSYKPGPRGKCTKVDVGVIIILQDGTLVFEENGSTKMRLIKESLVNKKVAYEPKINVLAADSMF